MQKLYPYLIAVWIMIFALFPAIEISVPMTENKAIVWLWLISAALGLYTLFFEINIFAKLTIAYLFIDCFFSSAPYLSFTLYIWMVVCAYFYALCARIENWTPVIRTLQIVILLNLILLFMQAIGKDSLVNFGLGKNITSYGNIGNPMQFKSFFIIASTTLIALTKPKILKNKKIFKILSIALPCAITIYLIKHNSWHYFLYARGPVWLKTLQLSMQRPFVGWGPGMYKIIFPALAHGRFEAEGVWRTAHNCWLQMLFEIGIIGTSFIAGLFISFLIFLRKIDLYLFFGLIIIGLDMLAHFPTRQISCIFLMLMFVAHCDQKIKEKNYGQPT